jgi:hypothetical protein
MRSLGDVLLFIVSFRILCLLFSSALTLYCPGADDHAPLLSRPFLSLFRAKEITNKQIRESSLLGNANVHVIKQTILPRHIDLDLGAIPPLQVNGI